MKLDKPVNFWSWSKLFQWVIGMVGVAGFLATFAVSAHAYTQSEIMRMVIEEASATGVPPALALAVARTESNFDPNALSSKGARGVMQIMPKTGADLYGIDADELWDPRLNIQIGIDFLEQLIERYDGHWDLALSYYNGGSAVGNLPNARVLPATRLYVDAVLSWYDRYQTQAVVWRDNGAVANPWRPARTEVNGETATETVEVHVRWMPAPSIARTLTARPPRYEPRPGTLDDFDDTLDARLAAVRGTLDDLTPILGTAG